MAEPHPNQLITCPYNKAHQVEHYRMHIHLQKCRRQYPNCKKVNCPFDSTHVVNDIELDYHMSVCPKRFLMDTQIYVMDDDYRPQVEVQPPSVASTSNLEECWDNEVTTGYKPDPAKMGLHVIKKVKGASPSERRQARMEGVKNYKPPEPQ